MEPIFLVSNLMVLCGIILIVVGIHVKRRNRNKRPGKSRGAKKVHMARPSEMVINGRVLYLYNGHYQELAPEQQNVADACRPIKASEVSRKAKKSKRVENNNHVRLVKG